jgi:hypothetical protein
MEIENLVKRARARFDHESARKILKEKYQARMLFAYNGGMWCAGPVLITLLQACPVEDTIVIEDLYGNPIQVNPLELQHLAFDRWQEQMNAWLVEHAELSRKR